MFLLELTQLIDESEIDTFPAPLNLFNPLPDPPRPAVKLQNDIFIFPITVSATKQLLVVLNVEFETDVFPIPLW